MTICAVILAGGQGRRLGGADKALISLHHQPLLAHLLETLSPQAGCLALSAAGDPARFAGFGLPVLEDGAYKGTGPLAGVLAGMEWAAASGSNSVFTVPVDTPFIPRNLALLLGAAPAVACYAGRVHHLVAVWPVAARQALAAYLETPGLRRVAGFAASLDMRQVEFTGPIDPFANINTPDDLAAAEARLGDLPCTSRSS
jgi:molybdopterin-guanine dinucleotide biosynthesis protein A